MTEAALKKVGLTRAQVERLTKDMKPPFIYCDGDRVDFMRRYIAEWRSVPLSHMARMLQTNTVKINEYIEQAGLGTFQGLEKIFICAKEMTEDE